MSDEELCYLRLQMDSYELALGALADVVSQEHVRRLVQRADRGESSYEALMCMMAARELAIVGGLDKAAIEARLDKLADNFRDDRGYSKPPTICD